MKKLKLLFATIFCFLLANNIFGKQSAVYQIDTLSVNGAWCWFADPRALYYNGTQEQTYFCWVNTAGDILVASYNHATGIFKQNVLHAAFQNDDHANPTLFIRKDGRIIVFYSKHENSVVCYRISTRPEDVESFTVEKNFGNKTTYPNPFQIGDDIVVFYRGQDNWHPTYAVSHDNGETWQAPQSFIVRGGARPYARYCQGPDEAVHIAFTTGHPRNEAQNKIFYVCYKNGAFYRADGSKIKDYTGSDTALDIDAAEAETVYNGSDDGKGWIWDIALDAAGRPVLVYASFPDDNNHHYHYARWTGTAWENHFMVNSGKWFPQTPAGTTEPEPNYSGGIYLDHSNPSIVYLSKQVNGVFEIYKYTTADGGNTWVAEAITENTPAGLLNVRPIVPQNHKPGYFDVVWMRGTYEYYANGRYNTSLVYKRGYTETEIDSIALSDSNVALYEGTTHSLSVTFYPFLLSADRTIVWTSSDEQVASVENGQVTAKAAGTAQIAATTVNGKTAACVVTVKEMACLKNVFFDFGTPSSPLASGATRVSEATALGESYGWMGTVDSRDRGSAWSDEERDFNLSGQNTTFRTFVENGVYRITVKQGDKDYLHDKMSLNVNGDLKLQNITAAKGTVQTNTFEVVVDNKRLDFEFSRSGTDPNWVVNSLKIEQIAPAALPVVNMDDLLSAKEIRIYNVQGNLVCRNKSNFSTLPNGVYLAQYCWNNGCRVVKYIKNL
ncbi:MAG: BNR-4 repeat-containing protein [Prevotella sp.]|jgi:hypothetical protein|nr:BNR-4 repeat-containing protein [Prevotella sp.]